MKTKFLLLHLSTVLVIGITAFMASAQIKLTDPMYRAYDGQGNPTTLDAIVAAMAANDAVFLGEQHDDAVGHALEAELFRRAVAAYSPQRKVALSLEMFERDVQVVVNEYLKGLISEQHFLLSSRPWPNYKTDYRPLVELAKEKHLAVIAANAPRRYVNMVSRNGRDSLNGLSKAAKTWLPPLPYPEPSETYRKKFSALMAGNSGDPAAQNPNAAANLIYSQSLWDATMGNSVAKYLHRNKHALVIQLNGGFHTESHLGTVEQLLKYRPKTKVLVVTMQPDDKFTTFDKIKYAGVGDFVILTAPRDKVVRLLPSVLERMQLHYNSLISLKADVEMKKYDALLKETDVYKGNVTFLPSSRTNGTMYVRINWNLPTNEQIVVISDQFQIYRPRLNQVLEGNLQKIADVGSTVAPLSFLKMSSSQLQSNYTINYTGQEKISDGMDTWHLEVIPKNSVGYKTAEIWVDTDGMPRRVRILEMNGNTTTVELTNIHKNVTVNASDFQLQIPSNVRRIKA